MTKSKVTFGAGNVISNSTDREGTEESDKEQSAEFRAKFGSTTRVEKSFSYNVVGRLSRWEGGNTNPYMNSQKDDGDGDENGNVDTAEQKEVTVGDFLRQFFNPSYDLTEVTVEDIDRTKMMHDRFLSDSQFDFNYSTLLIIASVIAALGLGNNSGASVIASMLVSPLMGPVTAIAYGISIGDFKMVRMGLVTEVASLIICIIIGAIFAACMFQFSIASKWPVEEMESRGTITNFWVGIPIAFFSGLGVAVGLLDSQTNSLVGVAISASLLPPAVNAGMLWIISLNKNSEEGEQPHVLSGVISLGLTIVNIIFIIIASMFMFRLKETLPIEKSIFWTDLGIARKIYHNVAIIPKLQRAPDDVEIKKRVTTFFPRASAMIMATDFRLGDSESTGGSGSFSNSFLVNEPQNSKSSLPRDSKYQWSPTSSGTSTEAFSAPTEGLAVISE